MTDPGILALWNDCAPDEEEEYERWYMAEHLPERVGNPGFRFGRRYMRIDGDRKYFTFYETDSPSVLWSPAYVERLQNPTDWTQQVMKSFRNTIRTVCRRAASAGTVLGGHAVTFRVTGAAPPEDAVIDRVRSRLFPDLLTRGGVCRAQLWLATGEQTPARTAETRIRGGDEMLSWAVIVETTYEEAGAELAADEGLLATLRDIDPSNEPAVGLYRLICILDHWTPDSDGEA